MGTRPSTSSYSAKSRSTALALHVATTYIHRMLNGLLPHHLLPTSLANTQVARQKTISKHQYFRHPLPTLVMATYGKRPTQPCEPFDNFKPTISTKSKRGSALHYGADPLKHRNTPRTRRANQHPIRLSPGRMRRQSPYPCRNTYSRPSDQRTPRRPLAWPAARIPHTAWNCARR